MQCIMSSSYIATYLLVMIMGHSEKHFCSAKMHVLCVIVFVPNISHAEAVCILRCPLLLRHVGFSSWGQTFQATCCCGTQACLSRSPTLLLVSHLLGLEIVRWSVRIRRGSRFCVRNVYEIKWDLFWVCKIFYWDCLHSIWVKLVERLLWAWRSVGIILKMGRGNLWSAHFLEWKWKISVPSLPL